MAIRQDSQSSFLLTFKVLQFVKQIRRRVKSRMLDGLTNLPPLGIASFGLRAPNIVSDRGRPIGKQHVSHTHCALSRVCKNSNAKRLKPFVKRRPSASDVSVRSDKPGGEVLQIIRAVDSHSGLSAVASNDGLFLKHENAPIFEGYSLNQLVQLLITVQEAVHTLAVCRLEHGDAWLLAQGLDFGLMMDENFIANYEHLLLCLRAELVEALSRKTLEELLRGGHDKRQRKLLSWFSEFAEKPRPLSTSFPWTIKPSLAVLWGVCWMFYDRVGDNAYEAKGGNDRVRGDKVLRNLDFPNSDAWSAPASSDYINFGLELIGAPPQHGTQQATGNNVTADMGGLFQARNTDTWESDLSPLKMEDFRLPSSSGVGPAHYGDAPPQPDQNTYYQHDLEHIHSISPIAQFLPQNPPLPLTVYTNLGNSNSLNFPWQHQHPRNSLPQRNTRHLITPQQAPRITVTGTPDSHFAQPLPSAYYNGTSQQDLGPIAASNQSRIYHNPQAPSALDTSFDFNNYPYTMVPEMSPNTSTPVALTMPPVLVKHERTSSIASNTGMPTPASIGPRSPLLSPTSGPSSHIGTSPHSHSRRVSEDRSSVASVDEDDEASMRKNHSYKRSEEPPRNQEGKMVCRHPDCTGVIFDRKCEWSKHMDKHDRPYKCNVKGCEKLQGFTYSGGLLRHEREVHKMHGGTKKSLFCPFPDCKRSSGAGFTRKENLAEHVRRVHRRTSMSADMHGLIIRRDSIGASPIPESRQASESPYTRTLEYREEEEMTLKRKRGSDAGLSDRGNDDLRAEIKRLRHEAEEKDSRLRQLEQAVMALQHQNRR